MNKAPRRKRGPAHERPVAGRRVLGISALEQKLDRGRSTIYRDIAAGTFPLPVRLPNGKTVVWLEEEIDAWIDALPKVVSSNLDECGLVSASGGAKTAARS